MITDAEIADGLTLPTINVASSERQGLMIWCAGISNTQNKTKRNSCSNQKAGCCGLQSCRLCGVQPGLVGLNCPECELCFIDPDNVI